MGLRHELHVRGQGGLRMLKGKIIKDPIRFLSRLALVTAAGLTALVAMSPSFTSAAPSPSPQMSAAGLLVSAADGEPPLPSEGRRTLIPTVISTDRHVQPANDRLLESGAPTSASIVDPSADPGSSATPVTVVKAVQATPNDAQNELQDGARVGFQMLYEARLQSQGHDYVVQVLRPGVNASRQALIIAGTEDSGLSTSESARTFDIAGQATAVVRGHLVISIAGPNGAAERLAILRSLRLVA